MPKAKQHKRSRPEEPIYYVIAVERSALAYSISHYVRKDDDPKPHSRHLELYGRLLEPAKAGKISLRGLPMTVHLHGDVPQTDEPRELPDPDVAYFERNGPERAWMLAHVPPDYISTLSAAFHNGRLSLVIARGPPLHRNSAHLTYLSFQERTHFEDWWGRPLSELELENAPASDE